MLRTPRQLVLVSLCLLTLYAISQSDPLPHAGAAGSRMRTEPNPTAAAADVQAQPSTPVRAAGGPSLRLSWSGREAQVGGGGGAAD